MTAQSKVEAATLESALVSALAEIGSATKDKVNPHFKSKYADLGSVIDAVKPVLARHNLGFTQSTEPSEGGVIVETVLWFGGQGDYSSGSKSLGKLFVPANKQDAQGFGSALTYARRYSLMTAFGVPAEDDDGNAAAKSYTPQTATSGGVAGTAGQVTNGERKGKLNGTYETLPKLETATKAFVHTLEGIDDLGELIGWLQTPEAMELQTQGMRDLPSWWDTGEGLPEEFVPVAERIHMKKRILEERESLHPRQQSVLEAG